MIPKAVMEIKVRAGVDISARGRQVRAYRVESPTSDFDVRKPDASECVADRIALYRSIAVAGFAFGWSEPHARRRRVAVLHPLFHRHEQGADNRTPVERICEDKRMRF